MLYFVSYNSTMAPEVRSRVENGLRAMPGWWHHLDTTWIVSTDQNLQDLTNHVHALAGPDDNFIIMDVTFGNYNGWLPSKAWEWLRNENVRERNRIAHAPNGQT